MLSMLIDQKTLARRRIPDLPGIRAGIEGTCNSTIDFWKLEGASSSLFTWHIFHSSGFVFTAKIELVNMCTLIGDGLPHP